MDWSNDKLLLLIELYKERARLWDPKHNEYKIKARKTEDWYEISKILHCDPVDAKRKIDSLLASFRRERQRLETKRSMKDEPYESTWFAFKAMSFLLDKFAMRKAAESENADTNTDCDETADEMQHHPSPNISFCTDFKPPPKRLRKSIIHRSDCDETTDEMQLPAPPKISFCTEFKPPPKRLRKNAIHRSDEAYQSLPITHSRRIKRDGSSIFGKHVAIKLRQYDDHTRNIVEHLISNILFDADMGKYAFPSLPTVVSSTHVTSGVMSTGTMQVSEISPVTASTQNVGMPVASTALISLPTCSSTPIASIPVTQIKSDQATASFTTQTTAYQ